jgi:hypothetical protein
MKRISHWVQTPKFLLVPASLEYSIQWRDSRVNQAELEKLRRWSHFQNIKNKTLMFFMTSGLFKISKPFALKVELRKD